MIQLCDIKECTGCGACYNVCPREAIVMRPDAEGFLRPDILSERCIECGLCAKVCPPLHPLQKYPRTERPIAAICKERDVVMKSSSGGLFPMLARWTFDRDGIVYGAVMDKENRIYHTAARNWEELSPTRSSKYAQSDVGGTYREVKRDLKAGKQVLYSGTPCQIAGLLNYLGKTDQSKLVTVDLVCHGTPSNKMLITYLHRLAEARGIKYKEIKGFDFRQRESWGITPSFEYEGKRILLRPEENVYMRLFLSSRLHRPCCYQCPYAMPERISDITLADFWGIGKKKAFLYDTKAGCSLVLPNSDKGKQIFKEISGNLFFERRDWDEALRYNHQLRQKSDLPKDRDRAARSLLNDSLDKTYQIFFNTPTKRLRRLAGKILKTLHLR